MDTILNHNGTKTETLGDDVYRILDAGALSTGSRYQAGVFVRPISGVDDRKQPGWHFDDAYMTVCRVNAPRAEYVGIEKSGLEYVGKWQDVRATIDNSNHRYTYGDLARSVETGWLGVVSGFWYQDDHQDSDGHTQVLVQLNGVYLYPVWIDGARWQDCIEADDTQFFTVDDLEFVKAADELTIQAVAGLQKA